MTPYKMQLRLLTRLNCPGLFRANTTQLPPDCLVWPTTQPITPRPTLKINRDRSGCAGLYPTVIKPIAKVSLGGKIYYVHKIIHELLNPGAPPTRARQTCSTPYCVHPDHWKFTPLTPAEPLAEPPPFTDEFPLSDAIDLVGMYLDLHPTAPLDLEHNYLIDIPLARIVEALGRLDKEHLIP